MLKKVGACEERVQKSLYLKDTAFPVPFYAGLEYSSPARGTWNIVHSGMLIPESHQIFVCALGCLRGVVLTAAEMNALDRYSSIQIREENVLDGGMEALMIDGVEDILKKLPVRPKAILLFISCQHFFLAYDQQHVFETLRKRFPDIKFMDCYMIPTLRKSGLTPDQKMRIQMYSLWEKLEKREKKINLIGSNLPLIEGSELKELLEKNGFDFWSLHRCKTFQDYMDMGQASWNLVYEPLALPSAMELEKRLGQKYKYMSFTFSDGQLLEQYEELAGLLQMDTGLVNLKEWQQKAKLAWQKARDVIGDTPIVLDYTFTFRTLNFARRLLEEGFCVKEIFIDAFLPEDEKDYQWLKEKCPDMVISPTNQPGMRFMHPDEYHEKILALGQKAAYFSGTDYFVNVAESGGFFGFRGMMEIADLMMEAFQNKKDRKAIIQRKGYGCESCV